MSKNNEFQVGVLFSHLSLNDNIELLIPMRVLLGVTDVTNNMFYDALSNQTYYNIYDEDHEDEPFHFNNVKSLSILKKIYPNQDMQYAICNYFKDIKRYVHFFDYDDEQLVVKEELVVNFAKKYKVKIDYQNLQDDIFKLGFSKLTTDSTIIKDSEVALYSGDKSYDFLPHIDELYDEIKKGILCQDEQLKQILTAIYRNQLFDDPALKANIFIYGPTGVGKTEILRQISKYLSLPISIEDSTSFTVAGYVGNTVTDSLRHLYELSEGDLERAEKGIVVFDEIDKKCAKNGGESSIAFEGVLHSLLKMIEGGVFEVEIDKAKQPIMFDTQHLTFVVSGAFEKMFEEQRKQESKIKLGFTETPQITKKNNQTDDLVEEFIKFGMPREFIGRFNTFIKMNELGKDDLFHILNESECSSLVAYIKTFSELGINLQIKESTIEKICDIAYKRKTGARALNNVVNGIFEKILYQIFCDIDSVKEIVIDDSFLDDTNEPEKVKTKKIGENVVHKLNSVV